MLSLLGQTFSMSSSVYIVEDVTMKSAINSCRTPKYSGFKRCLFVCLFCLTMMEYTVFQKLAFCILSVDFNVYFKYFLQLMIMFSLPDSNDFG